MKLRSLAVAVVLATPIVPALAAAPVDIPFERFQLPNGLTVVVHEDHKAPIVSVSVWYHVGSKDERPGRTGFAHLFEHLMFQGSENYNDEWFKPLEQIGGTSLNGTTWLDRTNYFQNVPTTALDTILWLESDRMGHLLGAIDQKRLDEQRGVVQNEKRQGENEPYGRVFEQLQLASFPEGHPYRWETIGSMEDLNAASLDDVKEWFRTHYGAANATLVLAGDIDVPTAKEKVARYFGDIDAGPPQVRREDWIAARTESTRDVMYDRVAQVRVTRSWNVPGFATADSDYLSVAATVLGGGKTSRLYGRLVYRDQIADSVSVQVLPFELAGLVLVQADVKQGVEPARVEQAIEEELAEFLKGGPSAAELERAKIGIRAGFVRGVERVGGFGGKADVLAECQVYAGDPGCFRESLARLDAATTTQVRDAAQRWLARGDYTLTVLPQPAYTKAESAVDRKAGVPPVADFPAAKFPPLERATLSNGTKLILAQRHEIPVVQLALLFDAGYAADEGRKLGTSSFALGMLDEGTTTLGPLQFAEKLEELGAQVGTGASVDMTSISLSALKDQLSPSLALWADMVRRPAFAPTEIARVRKIWLAGIAQEKTEPMSIALRLLPPLLFGPEHGYGAPFTGTGTEASIGTITRDDLVAFHRDWLRPDNATLLVVGDTTLAEIVPELEKHFGDWKPTGEKPRKNIAAVPDQTAPRVYLVDKPEAQQTTIIAGALAPPQVVPNELEIGTMNDVLGGSFNSRINTNLREDKHWSYGAGSFLVGARGQRPFGIYAPVQTDKTVESIAEVRKELTAFLGDRPPTHEEIERMKNADVRSLPGQFETAGAVLGTIGSMVRYGRPDDYVETLKARVEAQTDEGVVAAAKEVVHPERFTWIIVGDLAKIEQPIRALGLGEVKVMDADGRVIR
ncbi:MAG TPA: pitrilysin family protein [Xanthomonadales bacterium]|nr:pitrilysin family protein [Xanthomonadales bacterium]